MGPGTHWGWEPDLEHPLNNSGCVVANLVVRKRTGTYGAPHLSCSSVGIRR
jgi:hypothetical protein